MRPVYIHNNFKAQLQSVLEEGNLDQAIYSTHWQGQVSPPVACILLCEKVDDSQKQVLLDLFFKMVKKDFPLWQDGIRGIVDFLDICNDLKIINEEYIPRYILKWFKDSISNSSPLSISNIFQDIFAKIEDFQSKEYIEPFIRQIDEDKISYVLNHFFQHKIRFDFLLKQKQQEKMLYTMFSTVENNKVLDVDSMHCVFTNSWTRDNYNYSNMDNWIVKNLNDEAFHLLILNLAYTTYNYAVNCDKLWEFISQRDIDVQFPIPKDIISDLDIEGLENKKSMTLIKVLEKFKNSKNPTGQKIINSILDKEALQKNILDVYNKKRKIKKI